MIPFLTPDQEILASNIPYFFRKPKIEDVVVFKQRGEFIVKRIKAENNGKYLVKGDNEKDSKNYGWIDRKMIIGKMVYLLR